MNRRITSCIYAKFDFAYFHIYTLLLLVILFALLRSGIIGRSVQYRFFVI
jgi:hypothetical protein